MTTRKVDSPSEAAARAVLRLRSMTDEELLDVAVRAGIYTPKGELTPPYRDRRSMSARRKKQPTKQPLAVYMHVRVTERELQQFKALAQYLGETLSGMVRRLADEERKRLVAMGKRPPRTPMQ